MNVFHPAAWASSAFWQPAGEAMLEFLVSGTAVAAIFMLLRRVIGRLPATFRYAAASMSLATLVGLAGYHAWEHWPTTLSPSAAVTNDASPSAPSEPRAVSPPAVSAAAVAPAVSVTSQPGARFTWEAMKPRLILLLPGLWLIGAPLTALFVGLGWTGAARLRRHSTPLIDGTLLERFARCQTLLQAKNVGLAVCERIAAPIVVGVFRPLILLPPALLTSLTCEQWEMILLHELAHVRRFDNLVNLLQRGVETVLFFHPAVWWASRWMRLEREHCCDAVVLRLGTSPQTYAETLAVLALPGIAPQLATAAMANHELLTRMRHILGTEDLPMTISWKKLGLAAVVFAAVGGLMASEWSSSSQQAAADESRQKELEDKILRRVFTDLAVEQPVLVDYLRTRTGSSRNDSLQAVIKEIERLRAESVYASPADGELARRFSDRLIERLNRLNTGEKIVFDVQGGSESGDLTSKRSWSPEQMLGPPDVKEHSDNPKAWAARDPDQGMEWVRLGFERPVKAAAILIYESFNPGAVTSVQILGPSHSGEQIVWDAGSNGPNVKTDKNVLTFPIQNPTWNPISSVHIRLDERRVAGWNEIDAVGLVDAETGETHWATTAQASSTYASVTYGAQFEERPIGTGPRLHLIVPDKAAWSADQALGSPDVPEHSDHPNAWAAREPDKGEEWLQVGFGAEYEPAAIVIHESFNPGAIKAVQFFGHDELSPARTVRLESTPSGGTRVTVVRPVDSEPVEGVRILIDEPKVPGWNEIDAVGLIDAKTGETHWARVAKASSSFADVPQFQDQFVFTNVQINQVTDPSWHPRQATGAPNVPEAGDDGRAWASSTQDGQEEWLDLTYDPPVPARAVMVYESYNPGAMRKVTVTRVNGRSSVVWDAPDPVRVRDNKGVALVVLPNELEAIKSVRIQLDSKAVAGWNEIDAVGLLNNQTGQVQWASDAKASSWFGEQASHALQFRAVRDLPVASNEVDLIDVPVKLPPGNSPERPNWHPSQATGAPDIHEPGDNPKAWASATPDDQKEWLELTYDPPVLAASMAIYESYNPGAISEVQIEEVDPIADALPAGEGGFRTLMKGNQLYKQGRNGLGITLVTVKTNIRPIRRVRLLIDSPAHQGWNEIDAVGLLSTIGEMHWAKEAKASSWFGESGAMGAGGILSPIERHVSSDKTALGGVEVRDVADLVIAPPPTVQVIQEEVELLDVTEVPVAASSVTPVSAGDANDQDIEIDAKGVITVGGREHTPSTLENSLKVRMHDEPHPTIRIRAHQDCSFQEVKKVFEVCRQSGVTNLSLTRAEGKLDGEKSSSINLDTMAIVAFDNDITVNLNDSQPHLLRYKLRLLVDKSGQAAFETELERYRVVIKDRLLQHCGDKSTAELRGSAGIQFLKDGILSTVRDALPAAQRPALKDVLLEEILIQ
jgi:beta-lactamase regulating signal transducer with metallopeptidase domain/biopolymer transport protein ExbD